MKPFDIELARQGKPVCLRNGRKARIICFDVKGNAYPIIALVEDGEYEVAMYFNERGRTCAHPSEYDLMMASKKKEMYINIYRGGSGPIPGGFLYNTLEKAREIVDTEYYLTTAKVSWEE